MLLKKNKNVIIVGCGRFGASLAGTLSNQGYQVIIIDKSSDSFRKLPDHFSGYEVEGDASNTDILEKSGIKDCVMLIAVTDNDNVNSLIAQIASCIYNVDKVYVRINDIEKQTLIEGYNIEIICPYKLCLHEFEELSGIVLEEVSIL